MTHRLRSVRSRVVYACWRSLNVDVDRCALLALPLSRNGGYLVGHLHLVYRMRGDLRMRRYRPSATTAVIPPPRYLGLGDCEFLILIFSYFSSSVYYRIRVFVYVCTCFLVLVSHTVHRFIQNSHSFLYIVKIPTSLRLGSLHKVYHQYTICYANLVSHGAHYPLSSTRLCTHYRNRRPASPRLACPSSPSSLSSSPVNAFPCRHTFLAFLTCCEIAVTWVETEGTRIFHAGILGFGLRYFNLLYCTSDGHSRLVPRPISNK
jgi:hypothetical protein